MSLMEIEYKILGNSKEEQDQLVDIFMTHSILLEKPNKYIFTTEYYDTPQRDFLKNGYALRFRDQSPSYDASVEIKQIISLDKNISKRFELTQRKRSAGFTSLYFNILSNPNYPKILPRPKHKDLQCFLKTIVARKEIQVLVPNAGTRSHIEIAVDEIFYLDKDDRILNREPELEIEFELKDSSIDLDDFISFMDEFMIECEYLNLHKTLDSKSTRGMRILTL